MSSLPKYAQEQLDAAQAFYGDIELVGVSGSPPGNVVLYLRWPNQKLFNNIYSNTYCVSVYPRGDVDPHLCIRDFRPPTLIVAIAAVRQRATR